MPKAIDFDNLPLTMAIDVRDLPTVGMGMQKGFQFTCPCCDVELVYAPGRSAFVREAADEPMMNCDSCQTALSFYRSRRSKPRRKLFRPGKGESKHLHQAYNIGFAISKEGGVGPGGWWYGFTVEDEYIIWSELITDGALSPEKAGMAWVQWLEYYKSQGRRGRGLIIAAYNGFKKWGGQAPDKKKSEELPEPSPEALGLGE